MAKKVSTELPQADKLGINDIINQKIDIPAGHQLTYFPITGAVASSSVANQGPLFVLDSSPDTYWQPSDQVAGAHIELTCPNAYECYGVDIKFKESENKKFNLKVDILDKENNRWLTVAFAESSTIDDNQYERFQAAQHFKSDTYRIIINSVFDTVTGHVYTQPKITQIRLFGLVPNEDVIKYKNNITKDQVCPEGYGKDSESGQCVKTIPSEIIKPQTIEAKSSAQWEEPEGNDPNNILSVNPNDKLTLKGIDSYIDYGLSKNDKVYAVYIHKLNNPPRQYTLLVTFYNGQDKQPFYSFIVDIPDTQDKYVHILNQPIRADRFRLSVSENSEPQQLFSLLGLYLIGEPNVPMDKEPQKPKSGSIKKGGWGSKSDKKPEEWTAVPMEKKQGKWKGIGADKKNVFHEADSEQDAKDFIAYEIWKSKQTEPPTEPPTNPPTEPPTPPVEPPVEPPIPPQEGNKDVNGVLIMKPIKAGGQSVSKFTVERSVHNQSNEKNIKRDSIYGVPKSDKKNDTVNYATVMYVNTELSKDDQIDNKRCGGGHSSDNPKEGRCYPVGVMINKGKASGPFIAKEYPAHSDTPKFSNKVNVVRKEPLPDLNGKTFGLQTIGWAEKDSYKFECWLDLSVLDKQISDLKEPPNKWELFFTAEDKGDWTGEPYLTHQGLANKGTSLMLYGRIDHVTKPTEVAFAGAVEIEVPQTTPTAVAAPKPVSPQVVTGKTIALATTQKKLK